MINRLQGWAAGPWRGDREAGGVRGLDEHFFAGGKACLWEEVLMLVLTEKKG